MPAAFFLLLSSCWLQQVSSRKVWQLQLWPEGPASPVLAPGTLASHLVSHLGYFSAAPLCFAENMEQRLTERIHFHCSFNSQLISQELRTLPLTTSTMFFSETQSQKSQRHFVVFLELIIKMWSQNESLDWKFCIFITDLLKWNKDTRGMRISGTSVIPQYQQRPDTCWIPSERQSMAFRWLHLNAAQTIISTTGMKTLFVV